MEDQFYQKLIGVLPQNQVKIMESLKNHTSLHIGGDADYFVTPSEIDEIKNIIDLCKQEGQPFFVMGNGSNLLASDQGYRGLILQLGEEFSEVTIKEDGTVIASAGVLLSKLAKYIARESLTGFEFAEGIPGTLGGAVTMNAGAYDGEIKQCMVSALVMDEEGNQRRLSADELELGYRSSILQKNNWILLEAELKFLHGDYDKIIARMKELNTLRREKQPLDQYSAGSTFKRPQGYYAAKLIHECGLRGYQVGDAAVSEKHCGFVINKGKATAKDFITIIQDITRIVKEMSGVTLEPEVKYLGNFNNSSH